MHQDSSETAGARASARRSPPLTLSGKVRTLRANRVAEPGRRAPDSCTQPADEVKSRGVRTAAPPEHGV